MSLRPAPPPQAPPPQAPPSQARIAASILALVLVLLCGGCVATRTTTSWDGRRGYDGNGDYGYDLAASRSEARSYRARAARAYPAPGTPDDPWGPYVREAAGRFQIPERWIRAVMRQESGGHQYGSDGAPITSGAGAMGLMQVMPRTYDTLRQQYALGDDPFDPHNNILAGAAYIRDMYAVYGAPGFLAAYNAGPDRLATYLAGNGTLPDETVAYLANVAPRLGNDVAMTGPLAVYAGTATASGAYGPASDRAFAGGGIVVPATGGSGQPVPDDPADRAFEGGGLVTQDAPTGVFTGQPVVTPAVMIAAAPLPVVDRAVASRTLLAPVVDTPVARSPAVAASPVSAGGGWAIQVGAFPDPAHSQAMIAAARAHAGDLLAGTQPVIVPVQRAGTLYRARLTGLSAQNAQAACGRLSGAGMDCFAVPPGF